MSQELGLQEETAGHFARVASQYGRLRTTDTEPVRIVRDLLGDQALTGVDVGAGTGRYTELLGSCLAPGSRVVGLDLSGDMLAMFGRGGIGSCSAARSTAEQLPVRPASVDFVTTFNAVHHFEPTRFVGEAAAALAPGGRLFIYTRTLEQNAQSVFGRLFPGFAERETRLLTEGRLRQLIDADPLLGLDEVRSLSYARSASPDRLRDQVLGRHYSTFALYEATELDRALDTFLDRLNGTDIGWCDENILVVASRQLPTAHRPHR
jgi:SAM-dependent methyltransferase